MTNGTEPTGRMTGLDPAGTATLADGRRLRPLGLAAAPTGSRKAIEALSRVRHAFLGRDAALDVAGTDRHGVLVGDLTFDSASLAIELLRAGAAYASGEGRGADLDRQLAAEAEARRAGRGLWGAPETAELDAADIAASPSRFVVARGRIAAVTERGSNFYLDFSADWASDFTARVPSTVARTLKRAGLDPARLAGRTVRVRGWLFELSGAMIEIQSKGQIELLD